MPEVQKVGDSQALSNTPQPQPPSGKVQGGQVQVIGERINLTTNPVSNAPALGKDNRVQTIGGSVNLGTTPIKGLGSAAQIPMSKRAVEQSK